jgi:hypothetical protein
MVVHCGGWRCSVLCLQPLDLTRTAEHERCRSSSGDFLPSKRSENLGRWWKISLHRNRRMHHTEIERCIIFPGPKMERQFKKINAIWLGPLEEFRPKKSAFSALNIPACLPASGKRYNGSSVGSGSCIRNGPFFRRIGDGPGEIACTYIGRKCSGAR